MEGRLGECESRGLAHLSVGTFVLQLWKGGLNSLPVAQ